MAVIATIFAGRGPKGDVVIEDDVVIRLQRVIRVASEAGRGREVVCSVVRLERSEPSGEPRHPDQRLHRGRRGQGSTEPTVTLSAPRRRPLPLKTQALLPDTSTKRRCHLHHRHGRKSILGTGCCRPTRPPPCRHCPSHARRHAASLLQPRRSAARWELPDCGPVATHAIVPPPPTPRRRGMPRQQRHAITQHVDVHRGPSPLPPP